MSQSLAGKNAVVTGGTRGIGRAIAETLLREGVNVAICGRSKEGVETATRDLDPAAVSGIKPKVVGAVLDVSNAEAVGEYFRWADVALGSLDILVNNAGVGIFRPVADLTYEDWKATLDTNLTGVFSCCKEAIPRLRQQGGGTIVNISSLAGKNPFAGGSAYNASKFALNGFSEAMMLDHRKDNIRVSYVMPGSVDTEFGSKGESAPWKIAPQDVADIVLMVLRMPARTTVSRIEVRPSIPASK